uniref:small integral membrane protein 18-like n=1 Tax=Styela clava TaxID=7725 RepID=UPI00193AB1D2|nr:small integral membrane protein 18-like [Styela clava]
MTSFESIVGFDFDDLLKVDPFKDVYSIVSFSIFATFVATILILIAVAFLYSFCECCCPCLTTTSRKSEPKSPKMKKNNKVEPAGKEKMEMEDLAW